MSTQAVQKACGLPEVAYNPRQVEQVYGIREFTVRKMVRQGIVKGKPGRPFLVDAQSLREWYERQIRGYENA